VETTFQQDISSREEILRHLQDLLEQALQKAADKQLSAYTLTVKIKFHNFVQITRSRTLPHTVTPSSEPLEELIKNTGVGESSVRLLGVTLGCRNSVILDTYLYPAYGFNLTNKLVAIARRC
jgi:DNA polymerase-4